MNSPNTREKNNEKTWLGHPFGLSVLFNAELWERFSFYGMRALLVLYMVNEMKYDTSLGYAIYGAYTSLVYAFPVIGGWIANKWLGYTRSIILGGVLMALGHFMLAIPSEFTFFGALALLCVGNGFFKPNISSTVGRLYSEEDTRRERGFYIFYMGINFGAFFSPLICGYLGENIDWHYGFGAAGIGMCYGLVRYVRGLRHIADHGTPPDPERLQRKTAIGLSTEHLLYCGAFLVVPVAALGLWQPAVSQTIIQGVSIAVIGVLISMAIRLQGVQRLRICALMILMVFHMSWWAGFEQAGSSFNVMTDKHIDRHIFGIEIPASVFQSVNAFFVITMIPIFTRLWKVLDRYKRNPSIPIKFSLALILVAAGFWVLNLGIAQADENGIVALHWMILCYALHTMGELCLSPVGLSAVTLLVPKKWVGFGMGAWFLTISNGHIFAAVIAKMTSTGGDASQSDETLSHTVALAQYTEVFNTVVVFMVGAGVLLIVLSPFINRLMGGVR